MYVGFFKMMVKIQHQNIFSSSLFQVLVTNLDVETVTHYEPANFWIGPSAVSTTCCMLYMHTVFIFSIITATGAHSVHRFSSELKGRQCVLAFAMTFQTFEMILGY